MMFFDTLQPPYRHTCSNNMTTPLVLVVEDDPSTRRAICDILSLKQIQTLEADSGEECLELYKKYHKQIGLVCLDFNLASKLTGLQTAVQLKHLNPHINIVLLSGYNTDEIVSPDMRHLITGYICKPFTMQNLIAEVKRHLE